MKQFSRRKFLTGAAALAALYPVVSLVEGCNNPDIDEHDLAGAFKLGGAEANNGLRYIHPNGAYLYFYFVNVVVKRGHVIPVDPAQDSYMIVQLPPQSLHEMSMEKLPKDCQVPAKLSRSSFLTFKILPDTNRTKKPFSFSMDALLSWEDESRFKLLTTFDVPKARYRKFNSPAETFGATINTLPSDHPAALNGLQYYKLLLSKLFIEKYNSPQPFISVFEIPAGLITVPHIRDDKQMAKFIQNKYEISSQTYKIKVDGKNGIRKVYERWYGQLLFTRDASISAVNIPGVIPPVLRAIGLRNQAYNNQPSPCDNAGLHAFFPNFLPSHEIVYLNQLYNDAEVFDIRSGSRDPDETQQNKFNPSPFLLTSSGATVKFNYYNPNPPEGVNLVEYEHHFQDGRDLYIRIAEIGVITPSAEKALHVKTSKRQIADDGRSFLEVKATIRKHKELPKFPVAKDDGIFQTTEVAYKSTFSSGNDDLGDNPANYATYTERLPFTQIRSLFEESPPIKLTADNEPYFWVYKEGSTTDDYSNLMQLPFQFTDRNKKVLSGDNPVFFMRKTFFETPAAVDALLGSADMSKSVFAKAETDNRLRLLFNNQIISYTPDPPLTVPQQAAATEQADTDKNKLNQLPTEYIEYYFDIARSKIGDADLFNKWPLMIYPQMRRAKVYFDHFQHFSSDKLASVIKMNEDYLKFRFDKVKNQAKLILDHRRDFIQNKWIHFSKDITDQTDALDNKFKNGYERIRNMFSNAGDRIGASINPGLEPERFGLVKEALSLGATVNKDWEAANNRMQKVADMFKGEAADILNGIPFRSILTGLIDGENSPQFLLKKISGEIETFDKFLAQIKNDIVSKVVKTIQEGNDVITKLKGQIETAQDNIRVLQEKINGYKNQVLQNVPDYTTARNAALQLFEIQAMRFIDDYNTTVTDIRRHVFDETVRAWQKKLTDTVANNFTDRVKNTINTKKTQIQGLIDGTLKSLLSTVTPGEKKILDKLISSLADAITHLNTYQPIVEKIFLKTATPSEESGLLSIEQFFNKATVIIKAGQAFVINPAVLPANAQKVNWEDITWSNVAWNQSDLKLTSDWGMDQLRQLEIQLRAVAPGVIPSVNQKTIDIQKAITDRLAQIESSLYTKAVTCVRDIRSQVTGLETVFDQQTRNLLEQIIELVDLISQSSPAWYYNKYKTLQKDYNDLYARIQSFGGLVSELRVFLHDDTNWIKPLVSNYTNQRKLLADSIFILAANSDLQLKSFDAQLTAFNNNLQDKLQAVVQNNPLSQETAKLLNSASASYEKAKKDLNEKVKAYEEKLKVLATDQITSLRKAFQDEIQTITDSDTIRTATDAFNRFMNLYNSIRRQELNYDWQTDQFQPVTIGIIKFSPESNPPTLLNVKVSVVAQLDPLHPGNVIERIDVQTQTSIVNFSVTFLSAVTLGFSEVSFKAGSGMSSQTRVMIRDVKFEGALSFVQKLQEMLQSLGDGFTIDIMPGYISMAYFFDFPVISSPGFTFANFAIGVGVNIYFDRRPMTVSFMLSRFDRKATVAAGIYGGGFFANIIADPKRGIQSIEMALEMGAYLGISIGPIHGEVRMMVGLYFKKDDSGVILEGYFIAEGTLSVWILSVSARIYLGVRSQNSVVEGFCTVTYSVKVGFIKKSFSGSFRRRLAGAESSKGEKSAGQLAIMASNESAAIAQRRASITNAAAGPDHVYLSIDELIEEDNYQVLNGREWAEFYSNFFS